ncbi:MAG TPA: multiheme c-type cytochrome [Kofleriaceae bacterium]|nr:multiheme c-type cytochrome [Kofleriaceae bacterium]
MGTDGSDAVKYVLFLLALAACDGCDGGKYSVERLQNPETCKDCHPKHYDQWSGSMHAYASDDPVFVAMNKRGQRDTNGELGNFCLTCHAPMALELGLADGATFDPAALPPEARGITCFFCHNVEQVTDDHNNPIKLAMDQTMRGGAKNAVDTPAHHSKYDAELMASKTNQSTMCGSCHDLVTPAGVHLERSFKEWKESIWATNDPDPLAFLPQTCSNCHMFPTDGVIADNPTLHVKSRTLGFHEHMWPAIDQALTPFPQMTEQAAGIKRDLADSIGIKGPKPRNSNETPGGICLDPPGLLNVRVDSFSVGHMFPSGAAQDRRMWVHVVVKDAGGTILYERGKLDPGVDPEQSTDLTLNCAPPTNPLIPSQCGSFYDRTYKSDGTQAHFFWEVDRYDSFLIRPAVTRDPNAVGYDHSTTVQYQVAPAVFSGADRIEAELLMRPLPFEMLHQLEQSGDIDPSIRTTLEAMPPIAVGRKSIWTKATAGMVGSPAENTNCNPE